MKDKPKLNSKKSFSVFSELLGLVISLLVVIYLLPLFSFVTKEYAEWLPIAITTTIISTLFDVVRHLVKKPFNYLFKILSLIPSIYSIFMLAQIFPFNFAMKDLNTIVQFALYISVVAMTLGLVVHCIQFIAGIIKVCVEDSEVNEDD